MNQQPLSYIKGISFAPFHRRGSLDTQIARDSLDYMIRHTAADFIVLAPVGLQDDAHSEEICYTSNATFSDDELIGMIRYTKSKVFVILFDSLLANPSIASFPLRTLSSVF